MDEVNQNQVDSNSEASSVEEKKQDQVSYESFRKSVEAEKRARERAQTLEAELEGKKQAELESQGKHEEIIESLKSKLFKTESTLKEEREKYLWNNVTSTVKTEAVKHGCTNPDKLVKLLDNDDFSMLQAENGQIMPQSIAALMDKAKRENDFLFSKPAVRVNDAIPDNRPAVQREKGINEMNANEKLEKLKSNLAKVLQP